MRPASRSEALHGTSVLGRVHTELLAKPDHVVASCLDLLLLLSLLLLLLLLLLLSLARLQFLHARTHLFFGRRRHGRRSRRLRQLVRREVLGSGDLATHLLGAILLATALPALEAFSSRLVGATGQFGMLFEFLAHGSRTSSSAAARRAQPLLLLLPL